MVRRQSLRKPDALIGIGVAGQVFVEIEEHHHCAMYRCPEVCCALYESATAVREGTEWKNDQPVTFMFIKAG